MQLLPSRTQVVNVPSFRPAPAPAGPSKSMFRGGAPVQRALPGGAHTAVTRLRAVWKASAYRQPDCIPLYAASPKMPSLLRGCG